MKLKMVPAVKVASAVFLLMMTLSYITGGEVAEFYFYYTYVLTAYSLALAISDKIAQEDRIIIYHSKLYLGGFVGITVISFLGHYVFRDYGWGFMFYLVGAFIYMFYCQLLGLRLIVMKILLFIQNFNK